MAKLHRHKIAFVSFDSHNNSVLGTDNKNNTEYRTSVQKITLLQQNKENSEKKQTQNDFSQ